MGIQLSNPTSLQRILTDPDLFFKSLTGPIKRSLLVKPPRMIYSKAVIPIYLPDIVWIILWPF